MFFFFFFFFVKSRKEFRKRGTCEQRRVKPLENRNSLRKCIGKSRFAVCYEAARVRVQRSCTTSVDAAKIAPRYRFDLSRCGSISFTPRSNRRRYRKHFGTRRAENLVKSRQEQNSLKFTLYEISRVPRDKETKDSTVNAVGFCSQYRVSLCRDIRNRAGDRFTSFYTIALCTLRRLPK